MQKLSSSHSATQHQRAADIHPSTLKLQQVRDILTHTLQTSLDEKALLTLFYRHSRRLVNYTGVHFQRRGAQTITLGERAIHSCDYNMSLPDTVLGKITFYRKQRFSEAEQQQLESLLGTLAFPLRNAQQYQQALKLALLDPLTGVGNRSALNNALEREHQLMQRNGKAFALILLDIDHFKHINDEFGHARGDDIIKAVAETIEQVCRATDMTFRYGGEEFAVLLNDTGAAGALINAERLRRAIADIRVNYRRIPIAPTVSIGVSACADSADSLENLFERTDQALYRAKNSGRNRVCCEPPELRSVQPAD